MNCFFKLNIEYWVLNIECFLNCTKLFLWSGM